MVAASSGMLSGLGRITARIPDRFRPSLLMVTAGVAGLSAIANAVAVAAPATEQPQTRLGNSIQQSVRDRDRAMAEQKRALQLREQAAKATEERLKADLASRQAEAEKPAPRMAAGGKPVEANEPYDELARIYQTMKPAKAAPIFERLDLEVQTEVARRMRERAMALIMSNMSPNAAVQLSMALAGKPVPKMPVQQMAAAEPRAQRAPRRDAPAPKANPRSAEQADPRSAR